MSYSSLIAGMYGRPQVRHFKVKSIDYPDMMVENRDGEQLLVNLTTCPNLILHRVQRYWHDKQDWPIGMFVRVEWQHRAPRLLVTLENSVDRRC